MRGCLARFSATLAPAQSGHDVGRRFRPAQQIRYRSMIIRLDGDLAVEFATRFAISEIGLGRGRVRHWIGARCSSQGPAAPDTQHSRAFRALIQTAKGFKDPTQVIEPVMPSLSIRRDRPETRVIAQGREQTETPDRRNRDDQPTAKPSE